ncbi:MAG: biopolymer transporter ExbD [Halomonadaceae bacterium]|nr:MAG: biopolymer transporter ExbD [Halomonadaceae bacterium]
MTLPSFIPGASTPENTVTDRLEDGLLPLINVVFLLLMFFLIAGIIMQDALPPLPSSAETASQDDPRLDLVIAADGSLLQEGRPLSASELQQRLPSYDVDNRLRIGAHQDLSMADLEARFQELSEAGHPDVILLTDQAP